MADDLCQCPLCGRMHKNLGFGKPPAALAGRSLLAPAERCPPSGLAVQAVENIRDDEMFNVPSDARWAREIESAIKSATAAMVPIADFLELYDAAHGVIDEIRLHVDHAEYEGGMNAVEHFREVATDLRWKHADKVPDPLAADEPEDDC